MLTTLILLGLLPLAAMPFLDLDEDSSAAKQSAGTPADEANQTNSETTLSEPGEDHVGALYDVSAGHTPTRFAEFTPGEDIVEIDFSNDSPPLLTLLQDTTGVSAVFTGPDDTETALEFDGLSQLPSDDIMLRLFDEGAEQDYEVSLTDALSLGLVPIVLDPMEEDPIDPDLVPVDPDDVIDPVDPDFPDDPGPEIVGPILEPVDPDAEELGPGADLALRDLVERDSENSVGIGGLLGAAVSTGTTDVALTSADDSYASPGTTDAPVEISLDETVPVLNAEDSFEVVDGGAGDDAIALGDESGIGFGGAGDDTLSADGSAILYGGDGADALTLGANSGYADGGVGNDTLLGGQGDDTLEGGEHSAAQSAGDDSIDGGPGDDVIRGGYGADNLEGGAGNDVIDHQGRTEERQILTQREHGWSTGDDTDSLDGGAGDDTLIFDRHDQATGGAGQDLFWLYHDGAAGPSVAQVADFVVGEDFLRVSVNPNVSGLGDPLVEVRASADGADGEVFVNGDLVAVLQGAPGATALDVYAEVKPDIFP